MQARTDKHTEKKFQKLKKWFAFFNIKKLKKQAKLNDSDESDIEIFPLSPRGDHGKDVSVDGTLPSNFNSSTSSDEQSSTFSDLDQAEGWPTKIEVPGLVLTTPNTPTPGSSEPAKIKIKIGKGEMG